MEEANIVITGVVITPNPAEAGKPYHIQVTIEDKAYVVGDAGMMLVDSDSAPVLALDKVIPLADSSGAIIVDSDGSAIEQIE